MSTDNSPPENLGYSQIGCQDDVGGGVPLPLATRPVGHLRAIADDLLQQGTLRITLTIRICSSTLETAIMNFVLNLQ